MSPTLRRLTAMGMHTLFLFVGLMRPAVGDDPALPITVPVKTRLPPAAPDDAMALPQRPSPQVTLPDARLPQYQLHLEHRTQPALAELEDPRLRFLLALPDGPLLIEAGITIDGRPFRMARERRVADMLSELAEPNAPVTTAAVSTQSPPKTDEQPSATELEPTAEEPPAETDQPDADQPEVILATRPRYSPPPTPVERIRRYLAATGQPADPEQLRWMLTNWIDGPALLLLQDHFQRFRAQQRPAFDVLDRDRDQVISSTELQQVAQSIQECDLNRDDVVSFLEVAEVAQDPRLKLQRPGGTGRLVSLLGTHTPSAAGQLSRRIQTCYAGRLAEAGTPLHRFDHNGDGLMDTDELMALMSAPPDITLAIAFDSADPSRSTCSVTAVQPDVVAQCGGGASVITLRCHSSELHIVAVQDAASDQISLGAVEDGYPLLPELDPNGDDRLTIRERRQLTQRVARFDANRDGQLTTEETRAPIRLCIGLGPTVHQELAGLREIARPLSAEPVTPPDWFVRMDRNQDFDLSRGEFPGNDEQFVQLDADRDELVSPAEAVAFDARSQPEGGGDLPSGDSSTPEEPASSAPADNAEPDSES